MTAGPVPVAIRLPEGLVIRGHEWSRDGPAVVFIHDLGDDLDTWGPITGQMAAHGLRVISVELRGHGLSDGEPDPDALFSDIAQLLGEISASFGPVALVAYGSVTDLLLYLDESYGAPVQVLVAPLAAEPPRPIDWRSTRQAIRLVLAGSLDPDVNELLAEWYPKMKGQRLRVTGASDRTGPVLLMDQPQLLEHMVMFLRRYLTGHHLAWIAEHAEQLEAMRAERVAAEG